VPFFKVTIGAISSFVRTHDSSKPIAGPSSIEEEYNCVLFFIIVCELGVNACATPFPLLLRTAKHPTATTAIKRHLISFAQFILQI